MEWSQPQIQGDAVTPRAGHAGITIDENWYIVGGGDNSSGKYWIASCSCPFLFMHWFLYLLFFCRLPRNPYVKYV